MNLDPQQLLLVGAVAGVGILHTAVPDHWAPIALMARQRHWPMGTTIRASAQAGTGHVLSTLSIGAIVWFAGAAVAEHFGHIVDTVASIALIAFGLWVTLSAWHELKTAQEHERAHKHGHSHDHHPKTGARTALLLILGSSPMIEGLPAFFAAGKYGFGLIVLMSAVFAISTIVTYVLLCALSTVGLQRLKFGAFERYGEVISGLFIALIGLAFWIWPFSAVPPPYAS